MHSHGETSEDFDLVCLEHFFEGKIVAKSDTFAVLGVTIPHHSFTINCVSTNCCLMGSCCSREVVEQLRSAAEAERSSESGGFWLVCPWFFRCPERGHW